MDAINEESLQKDIITVPIFHQDPVVNPLSRKNTSLNVNNIMPIARKSTLKALDIEKIINAKKTMRNNVYKIEPIERTQISDNLLEFLSMKGVDTQ